VALTPGAAGPAVALGVEDRDRKDGGSYDNDHDQQAEESPATRRAAGPRARCRLVGQQLRRIARWYGDDGTGATTG